jgi:hypothetical protein
MFQNYLEEIIFLILKFDSYGKKMLLEESLLQASW